jgi:hypothetical protein
MVKNGKAFMALALALSLLACDNQEEKTSARQEPSAGESALPSPAAEAPEADVVPAGRAPESSPPISGDLDEVPGSMEQTSPGGEAVTEQELPHSDLPPPSREAFTDVSCDFEEWVGNPVDEAAVKDTGRVYRILKPDSMMTMDHNPERINIVHDDDGVVTRVWCG